MKMYRVVLDTNVLVSALLSQSGNPAKILKLFYSGAVTFVYSEDIMTEYMDVLYRPNLRIPVEDADIVLHAVRFYGEFMEPTQSAKPMIDEDDRIFLDTAESADAYLITGNIRHYPNSPQIFSPSDFIEFLTKRGFYNNFNNIIFI